MKENARMFTATLFIMAKNERRKGPSTAKRTVCSSSEEHEAAVGRSGLPRRSAARMQRNTGVCLLAV